MEDSLPKSSSGPMIPNTVVNSPKANSMLNPMVQNMNRPNCENNRICANNMKAEPPIVVTAPENTEIPT